MNKKNRKNTFLLCGIFATIPFLLLVFLFVYINLPVADVNGSVKLGTTFSSRYASDIGLDWKEVYLAALDDLKIKNVRISIYWDMTEREMGKYDFEDIDWQMNEAAKRNVKVTLVIGQKVPRWPECFIPEWANGDDELRKNKLLIFIDEAVRRYVDHPALFRWQVENEPFLDFGICPSFDKDFFDLEIAKVKDIDQGRNPVMVTDSGELSFWVDAAKRADIFGTTMYRTVYSSKHGFIKYPIGPNFFKLKKKITEIFAGQKDVIVIELQGEPWIDGWTVSQPMEKQLQSMNASILRDNVRFAKNTGFSEVYLWGVEWWFWLKKEKNDSLWEEARLLFQEN